MRNIYLSAVLGSAALAAACTQNVGTVRDMPMTGESYESELARNYKDFALYEADQMYDPVDAEHFATKAIAASQQQPVWPEDPGLWSIEEKAKRAELRQARARLVKAMHREAATMAPADLARAQSKYDCWVEQQEEGFQKDHIAACRAGFMNAMMRLEETTKPKPVAAMETETVKRRATTVESLPQSFLVHFDFDSAAIGREERNVIDEAVEAAGRNDAGRVIVVGHADRAGPATYNDDLSLDRANAVRRSLQENGIVSGNIIVRAEGEDQPIIQTGDGVPNRGNRVVQIRIEEAIES